MRQLATPAVYSQPGTEGTHYYITDYIENSHSYLPMFGIYTKCHMLLNEQKSRERIHIKERAFSLSDSR